MDSLRSILPKVLRKRGLEQHAVAALVSHTAQAWFAAELPHLSGSISVKSYAHAVLTIECRDSIAAQECQQMLPLLREHLHTSCPSARIDEMRVCRESRRHSGQ